MTEKQEKILDVALQLFAEVGYVAASTSKIAKLAGVSEGLIFRHFENKEGLLNAILDQGREKVNEMFRLLEGVEDPEKLIQQIVDLPFKMAEDQKQFWKLVYALKWQADVYDDSMSAPIKSLLVSAFAKLGYTNAEAEAHVMIVLLDGLVAEVLLRKTGDPEMIKQSILSKYNL